MIWDYLFALAEQGTKAGEVPVAAAITHEGTIIASAHNQVETLQQATAHAEMLVLHEASNKLGTKHLANCDLYVTLEPCAMCATAIAHSRIRRLYFGAYDPKAGAVDHGVQYFRSSSCHHVPEIYGGIREKEASALLKAFFFAKR